MDRNVDARTPLLGSDSLAGPSSSAAVGSGSASTKAGPGRARPLDSAWTPDPPRPFAVRSHNSATAASAAADSMPTKPTPPTAPTTTAASSATAAATAERRLQAMPVMTASSSASSSTSDSPSPGTSTSVSLGPASAAKPAKRSLMTAINTKLPHRPFRGRSNSAAAELSSSFPPVRGRQPEKIGPQRFTKGTKHFRLLPEPDTPDDAGLLEGGDGHGKTADGLYGRIRESEARYVARLGRNDREWLPRVTAYCVADKYRLEELIQHFKSRSRRTRGANPLLVDECIYTPYTYARTGRRGQRHMHTEPEAGNEDYGGRINHGRSESGQQTEEDTQPLLLMDPDETEESTADRSRRGRDESSSQTWEEGHSEGFNTDLERGLDILRPEPDQRHAAPAEDQGRDRYVFEGERTPASGDGFEKDDTDEVDIEIHIPEVFVFGYGTVVIWGMTVEEEKRFIREISPFESDSLASTKAQEEAFNFYYTQQYQARIYNDFISLQDKENYKMKLAVSHALSQSVKTSLYEEMVEDTIAESKDLPTEIAEEGKVKLSKKDIHKFIGRLFLLRINIHLQGSVLDSPELMWREPQLDPAYQAVRAYLEMDERVNLLTERLTVVSDLLSVLRDQLSHSHDEYLEWIVIILIAAEILVAAINIVVDLYADAS